LEILHQLEEHRPGFARFDQLVSSPEQLSWQVPAELSALWFSQSAKVSNNFDREGAPNAEKEQRNRFLKWNEGAVITFPDIFLTELMPPRFPSLKCACCYSSGSPAEKRRGISGREMKRFLKNFIGL